MEIFQYVGLHACIARGVPGCWCYIFELEAAQTTQTKHRKDAGLFSGQHHFKGPVLKLGNTAYIDEPQIGSNGASGIAIVGKVGTAIALLEWALGCNVGAQ